MKEILIVVVIVGLLEFFVIAPIERRNEKARSYQETSTETSQSTEEFIDETYILGLWK